MIRKIPKLSLFLMIMFILLLSGCSATHAKTRTITIGISAYPGWYPWFAVQKFHEFEKENVNVKLVWFNTYSDSLQAYSGGKIDAVSASVSDSIPIIEKGVKSKIVLVNDNSAGADGIVANKKFKTLKDLKGAKVVTETGTIEHFFLLNALKKAGLKESQIHFTNMAMDECGTTMIANRADAAGLWQPTLSYALSNKKNHLLYSSAQTPGLIPDVLLVHQSLVTKHRSQVNRIVKAYFKGINDYANSPNRGIEYMASGADISKKSMRQAMKGSNLFGIKDNYATLHSQKNNYRNIKYTVKKTSQFLTKYKMVKHSVNQPNKYFDTSFVDELYHKDPNLEVINPKTGKVR